eukprot:CAMPEP_0205910436 /NCGR_PEP_ID=MMETSP1325-20131115/4427_1 /ASSEMBLY_ACC=CAM_ASM_000708 /TAXON_ID=236786 /ORGANISM="Florenciella sp., Strain RCC1007" /LENGTH=495 /DNA_ID=CAMNT_0053276785 /DNA_START=20 /DNA_END=1504 /DNA_ORIENTATION=+
MSRRRTTPVVANDYDAQAKACIEAFQGLDLGVSQWVREALALIQSKEANRLFEKEWKPRHPSRQDGGARFWAEVQGKYGQLARFKRWETVWRRSEVYDFLERNVTLRPGHLKDDLVKGLAEFGVSNENPNRSAMYIYENRVPKKRAPRKTGGATKPSGGKKKACPKKNDQEDESEDESEDEPGDESGRERAEEADAAAMEKARTDAVKIPATQVKPETQLKILTFGEYNAALAEQETDGGPAGETLGVLTEGMPWALEDCPFVCVGPSSDSALTNCKVVLRDAGGEERVPTKRSTRRTKGSWFMNVGLDENRLGVVVHGAQLTDQMRLRFGHALHALDPQALVPPGADVMTLRFDNEGALVGGVCGTLGKKEEEDSDEETDGEGDDDGEGAAKDPCVYQLDFAVGAGLPWAINQLLACFGAHAVTKGIDEPVCRARASDGLKALGFKAIDPTGDDGEALVECEIKRHSDESEFPYLAGPPPVSRAADVDAEGEGE